MRKLLTIILFAIGFFLLTPHVSFSQGNYHENTKGGRKKESGNQTSKHYLNAAVCLNVIEVQVMQMLLPAIVPEVEAAFFTVCFMVETAAKAETHH